ncbi:endolytic transglycosylase MltG [Bacteroidales bacterium OttesenSCG-928-A17]|nr:endolytic transglycosylase MltG [Bacteroidales bacterium OttesenSCG-928-A17]
MKKKTVYILLGVILFFLLLSGGTAVLLYAKINSKAFDESADDRIIYVDGEKDYQDILFQLDTLKIKDLVFFQKLSSYMKYPGNIKSGRYILGEDVSYLDLIRKLRSGNQDPIHFTFNNIRLKKDLAERVGEQFLFGSQFLEEKLNDSETCESLGFDTITIVSMFIPNTYEIYWNISVDRFLERMKKEYDRFWTPERLKKAEKNSLTPIQVSVLASIVEEETAVPSEYPVVAGLYINRLKKGMLLQADPTVKFAVGDVTLKRILYKHLEVDSPYNTYKNPGTPPGPIRIPSIAALNAVLNPTQHNYLYMVAKEDFSGQHNFSRNLSEHNAYARKYQDALNRAGIR